MEANSLQDVPQAVSHIPGANGVAVFIDEYLARHLHDPPVESVVPVDVAQLEVSRQNEGEESQRVRIGGDGSGSTGMCSDGENLRVEESIER